MASTFKLKRKTFGIFNFGIGNFSKGSQASTRAEAAARAVDRYQQQADAMKKAGGDMTGYNDILKKRNQWQQQQQKYANQASSMYGKGARNLAIGSVATIGAIAAGKSLFDKFTGED